MTLDRQRYARHLALWPLGQYGQERFLASAIRLHGTGRAAEEAALYLCAAGVGRLILDPPLQARIEPRLAELNPDCRLVAGALDALDIRPDEPERRASGALAALQALLQLSQLAGLHPMNLPPALHRQPDGAPDSSG